MKRVMLCNHPLTRAFTANADVTVVRITNKAVSAALQLAVEFIEHEVTQQWRKRSSLRSSFHGGADQSFSITPAFRNARMSLNTACPRHA